jgi:tetratricopeptide (TPR) repeat protein
MTTAEAAAGTAFALACAAFVAYSAWRPSRVRLLLAAMLISLLPVANIIPLTIIGNIGHERFLLLPAALAVLALVGIDASRWQLSDMLRSRLPVLVGGAALLWIGIALLNLRVTLPLWRNDLVLWNWAYSSHPDAPIAQFSLASAALQAKRNDIAQRVIAEAEKRGPLPLRLSVPYGQYLIRIGEQQKGIEKIETALKSEPQPHLQVLKAGVSMEDASIERQSFASWLLVYAYSNLAEGHLGLRQFKEAQRDAEIAIFYQRDNPVPYLFRSMAIYGQDRWDDAEVAYRRARDMYVGAIRYEADEVRSSFLRQLCGKPQSAPSVCARAAAEPKSPVRK